MILKSFMNLSLVLSWVVCVCLFWFLGSRYLACSSLLFPHPFPVNEFICLFQAILEVLFPKYSSCNLCGGFKWHGKNWNSQRRISFNFGGTYRVSVLLLVCRVQGCCYNFVLLFFTLTDLNASLVGNVCSHSPRYSYWSRLPTSISM